MKEQIANNDILTLCSEYVRITDTLSFSDPLRMARNSPTSVEAKKNACFLDFRNLLNVFDLRFVRFDEGNNMFRFWTTNRLNWSALQGDLTCLIAKHGTLSLSKNYTEFVKELCRFGERLMLNGQKTCAESVKMACFHQNCSAGHLKLKC